MTVTPDGNGFAFTGELIPSASDYEGVGLFFNSPYCLDVSAYTGVRFGISGELGGCTLTFGDNGAGNVSTTDDPSRGECTLSAGCYGPMADISAEVVAADAGFVDAGTPPVVVQVPFASEGHGAPVAALDPSALVTLQWQITAPAGGACRANLTIANVSFY
jgi:hypothetical protein